MSAVRRVYGHECKRLDRRNVPDAGCVVFIGALQIAVRLSAPFLKSKVTDPAVLVMDEKGQYCIPVLSGHIGGANEMAVEIGKQTGALPVITTATDINQRWAVDVFAKRIIFI